MELVLTVRPNVYVGEELPEPEFQYVPESNHIAAGAVPRADLVSQSILLLKAPFLSSLSASPALILTMSGCRMPLPPGRP